MTSRSQTTYTANEADDEIVSEILDSWVIDFYFCRVKLFFKCIFFPLGSDPNIHIFIVSSSPGQEHWTVNTLLRFHTRLNLKLYILEKSICWLISIWYRGSHSNRGYFLYSIIDFSKLYFTLPQNVLYKWEGESRFIQRETFLDSATKIQ